MKAVIFHPFQRVWTPRTPDSGYDSLGSAPLTSIVMLPLISEGIGTGIALEPGTYEPVVLSRGSSEGAGAKVILLSGTYKLG